MAFRFFIFFFSFKSVTQWYSRYKGFSNAKFLITFIFTIAYCSAGSYYTESGNCSKCPLGSYQPDQGQRECISCGQNFTTTLNGTSKESDCIGNIVSQGPENRAYSESTHPEKPVHTLKILMLSKFNDIDNNNMNNLFSSLCLEISIRWWHDYYILLQVPNKLACINHALSNDLLRFKHYHSGNLRLLTCFLFLIIFLQLTVQQVHTVPRTERAAYVPVVLINLKEGGHLVFSADKI